MLNKINRVIYLLVFCFFISLHYSQAQENKDFRLSYYYPTVDSIDLTNISAQNFSTMPCSNNFAVKNSVYWLKLQLDSNNSFNNSDAIVSVPTHNIDYIALFYLSDTKLHYISKIGNLITPEEFALDYKFPAFKIHKDDIGRTSFMKVHFPKRANFPLKVIS